MYRDKKQRDFARNLRNQATSPERQFWHFLRAQKQEAGQHNHLLSLCALAPLREAILLSLLQSEFFASPVALVTRAAASALPRRNV